MLPQHAEEAACQKAEVSSGGRGGSVSRRRPTGVWKGPDVREALVAMRDGTVALAEADVVKSGGNDCVIADGVRDKKRHADRSDGRCFFLVASDHRVPVAQQ